MNLPALTLYQPHASLLMWREFKTHETRSWCAPRRLIGQRWAIHSAKMPIDEEGFDLCEELEFDHQLPLGEMLGTALLASCLPTETTVHEHAKDWLAGNWDPGRWAWRFEEREVFAETIPTRGGRGVWWWDPENPNPPPPARRPRVKAPSPQLDLFAEG